MKLVRQRDVERRVINLVKIVTRIEESYKRRQKEEDESKLRAKV